MTFKERTWLTVTLDGLGGEVGVAGGGKGGGRGRGDCEVDRVGGGSPDVGGGGDSEAGGGIDTEEGEDGGTP